MANDPTATKMKLPKSIIFLIVGMEIIKASPLPIDPMWKSESFIKAYTASYGIDSRIEPNLDGYHQYLEEDLETENQVHPN